MESGAIVILNRSGQSGTGTFAFSPSLIAHFSLAGTNDGVMALMTFATTLQLSRWRDKRSLFQTALLGLVLGGLPLAKTASLPLFSVAVGLLLILKADAISLWPNEWNWKDAAIVLIISFLARKMGVSVGTDFAAAQGS